MRKRPRLIGATVATAIVAGGALWLLLPPRQTHAVTVPADDATPEQVVASYVEALEAHDCGTAELLTTRAATHLATSWCQKVARLSRVEIGASMPERAEWSERSAKDEVVSVPVRFDLDWRWLHDDGSMPEGETIWGYRLVRESPGGPWRIFDNGVA